MRRKYRSAENHQRLVVGLLQAEDVFQGAIQPAILISLKQHGDHRLRMDPRDKLVRIERHHSEPRALLGLLPEPSDREHGRIRDQEPHFTLQLGFAVGQVVLVQRPFAVLLEEDQAALLGFRRQRMSLGKRQIADIRYWPGSRIAEDRPERPESVSMHGGTHQSHPTFRTTKNCMT